MVQTGFRSSGLPTITDSFRARSTVAGAHDSIGRKLPTTLGRLRINFTDWVHWCSTHQGLGSPDPYETEIGLAYLSGQIPLDPATNQLVEGDIGVQTARVLQNVKAVLEACGASLESVLKTT